MPHHEHLDQVAAESGNQKRRGSAATKYQLNADRGQKCTNNSCMLYVVNAPTIINSPWAMLITPIWPKIMARPSAIKTRIDPLDSPSLRQSKAATQVLVSVDLRDRLSINVAGRLVRRPAGGRVFIGLCEQVRQQIAAPLAVQGPQIAGRCQSIDRDAIGKNPIHLDHIDALAGRVPDLRRRIGRDDLFQSGQQFDSPILARRLDRGDAFFKVVGPQGERMDGGVDRFPIAPRQLDLLQIAVGKNYGLGVLNERFEGQRIEQRGPLAGGVGGSLLADRGPALPKIEIALLVRLQGRGQAAVAGLQQAVERLLPDRIVLVGELPDRLANFVVSGNRGARKKTAKRGRSKASATPNQPR